MLLGVLVLLWIALPAMAAICYSLKYCLGYGKAIYLGLKQPTPMDQTPGLLRFTQIKPGDKMSFTGNESLIE